MLSNGSRETLRRRITLAFILPLVLFAAAFLASMLVIGRSFIIDSIYDFDPAELSTEFFFRLRSRI